MHGLDLCGKQKFTARSASTPSTRRLLDGVLDAASTADTRLREESSDAALHLEVHAAQGVLDAQDVRQHDGIVHIVQ